jgi:hypothetical protein
MTHAAVIKRVVLNEHHLRLGRTKHTLHDTQGIREFPPFVSLEIAQYQGETGYYLLHLCETGQGTDSWHPSLDDALHQAEYEFDVRKEEWTEIG